MRLRLHTRHGKLPNPNRRIEFSDGVLTLQQIFMQSEHFDFFNSGSSAGHAVQVADIPVKMPPDWGHAWAYPFGG